MAQRKTILLVDDVELFLHLGKTLLLRTEFTTLAARSGKEALDAARKHHPDLILLDLYMPDMNGDEVCRRIKAEPETSGIKVIICSSEGVAFARDSCVAAGCDGFITKPIRGDALLAELEKHLGAAPRRAQRVKTALPCTLHHGRKRIPSLISSLSTTGAFIQVDRSIPLDQTIQIEAELPGTAAPLRLPGVVRWWGFGEHQPDGIGVEFTGLGQAEVEALRGYLSQADSAPTTA